MSRICESSIARAIVAALFLVTAASATVTGFVNITSGNGLATASGVSLMWGCDSTAIDVVAPNTCGQSQIGGGTTLTSTGGTPPLNSAVYLKDLGNAPIANFMEFDNSLGNAIAIFVNLASFGPLPGANCDNNLNTNCVIFNGAPLQLLNTAVGVTATLDIIGTATDSSANVSNFSGAFTTQLNTQSTGITGHGAFGQLTDADIQAFFGCPSGASGPGACNPASLTKTIASTHSGTFQATFASVPEPQTTALVLGGLLVLLGRVGMRRYSRGR